MTQHDPDGFELLTNHRLENLEATVKEDHRATEELRVALVEFRAKVNTRAAMIGGGISLLVSLAVVLIPLFL